jgi:hypothetical protein
MKDMFAQLQRKSISGLIKLVETDSAGELFVSLSNYCLLMFLVLAVFFSLQFLHHFQTKFFFIKFGLHLTICLLYKLFE